MTSRRGVLVASGAAASFLVVLTLFALQVRAGADPAIGAGTKPQIAPRPVLVRRVIVRRIVEDPPRERVTAAAPPAPAVPAASAPAPAAAVPAPAPAPAPVAAAPAPAPAPAAPAPAPAPVTTGGS